MAQTGPVIDNGSGDLAYRVRQDDGSGNTQPAGDALARPVFVRLSDGSAALMPAAGALADGTSNPTTTLIGSLNVLFNGSTWDRQRNNMDGTVLTSGARTTGQSSSALTNYNGRGVMVFLNVTAASGTGGLFVQIFGFDGAATSFDLNAAPTGITATGKSIYVIYPGATGTVGTAIKQQTATILPRTFGIRVDVGDNSSYTYSLYYSLLV